MARPKKNRNIECFPKAHAFKPTGLPACELESVNLTLEEFEAIRLYDYDCLYQQDAADKMGISRQTFGNIIKSAHKKISDAIINYKVLLIEDSQEPK